MKDLDLVDLNVVSYECRPFSFCREYIFSSLSLTRRDKWIGGRFALLFYLLL